MQHRRSCGHRSISLVVSRQYVSQLRYEQTIRRIELPAHSSCVPSTSENPATASRRNGTARPGRIAYIHSMSRIPIIGITVDAEPAGGWSKLPWYALRRNYAGAVAPAGGLPMLLPHEVELVEPYLDGIDALVVTGGAFDIDPALFGAATRRATVTLKADRPAFELGGTRGALARDMPVLGICGGQHLLHVALGRTRAASPRGRKEAVSTVRSPRS